MTTPANASSDGGYDPRFFAEIAKVEDEHFWFCARNRIIAAAVKGVVERFKARYRVLEIGCGTGVVLEQLQETCRGAEVMGMDVFPEAVEFASRRAKLRVVQGDILNPPQIGKFELVGMFDVLEHLPNDVEILIGLNRLLTRQGRLLITVPAHPSLWSYFDVASCHCRRYLRAELTSKLQQAGFEVEYLTEFMMSIFPVVWAKRRLRSGNPGSDRYEAASRALAELRIIPGLNGVLKFMLSQEARVIEHRWRLPVGTSILAVARLVSGQAVAGSAR
jgi:SAM-dependent methyltransferase